MWLLACYYQGLWFAIVAFLGDTHLLFDMTVLRSLPTYPSIFSRERDCSGTDSIAHKLE